MVRGVPARGEIPPGGRGDNPYLERLSYPDSQHPWQGECTRGGGGDNAFLAKFEKKMRTSPPVRPGIGTASGKAASPLRPAPMSTGARPTVHGDGTNRWP